MQCFIYRCNLKPDMYIYLAEENVFNNIPREIYNTFGIIEFAMELEISAKTRLTREDTSKVISNLKEHGFHLQLPSSEPVEAIMARIAQQKNRQE